jgi:hypothetical protein
VAIEGYTLEQAEQEIAELRGLIDVLTEAHTKDDATDTPGTPASGVISFSTAGQEKYTSSDGNAYNTGRQTNNASNLLALTTSMQTVPGLSAVLGAGSYRVRAQCLISNPGTGGQGAISYRLHPTGGLTASSGRASVLATHAANGITVSDFATLDTTLTATGAVITPNIVATFDGFFVFSAGGTINVQLSQAATAAVTVVQNGSYLDIYPVS